jgi:Protein of unknown function (DUF2911)
MRRVIALACAIGLLAAWTQGPLLVARARGSFGQARPVLSPHETTQGTVDGATLSITYGRPSMRGRKIFGSLVPFDRVWCPGADECTRLSTNRDLQFEGLKLKAGDYSLWMLPTEKAWTLTFNSDGHAFHTYRDPRLDVGKITLQKQTLPGPVQQLTFDIGPTAPAPGGVLSMSWETTRVFAKFTVAR